MKIMMVETRIMPFGVFAGGQVYDTDTHIDLTEGQAKTFVLCGAATEVASLPSGEKLSIKKKVIKNEPLASNT